MGVEGDGEQREQRRRQTEADRGRQGQTGAETDFNPGSNTTINVQQFLLILNVDSTAHDQTTSYYYNKIMLKLNHRFQFMTWFHIMLHISYIFKVLSCATKQFSDEAHPVPLDVYSTWSHKHLVRIFSELFLQHTIASSRYLMSWFSAGLALAPAYSLLVHLHESKGSPLSPESSPCFEWQHL